MEVHVSRNIINKTALISATVFALISCAPGNSINSLLNDSSDNNNASASSQLETYSPKPANFRVSLTDAPAKDLKSVFVNVLSVEVWLKKDVKEARVVIGKNLGMVDLMTLRNGVLLPIEDLSLPAGIEVTRIRLILGDGNYGVKTDGSQCSLQTPSAQQSGIKISLTNPVTLMSGNSYSLVVDFDAEKSVVVKGNGGCLLKPVLKIASFTKVDQSQIGDDGGSPAAPGDDLMGGVIDSNLDQPTSDSSTGGATSSDGTTTGSTDGAASSDGSATGSTDGAATDGSASNTDNTDAVAGDTTGYDTGDSSEFPPIVDPDLVVDYLF